MPDPRDNWLLDHARSTVNPTAEPYRSPFAPADATRAGGPKPHKATLSDVMRAGRHFAGGAVKSLADVPVTVMPNPGSRNGLTIVPLPKAVRGLIERAGDAVSGKERSLSELVTGGDEQQRVNDESFEQMGNIAGMVGQMAVPANALSKMGRVAQPRLPGIPAKPVPASTMAAPSDVPAFKRRTDISTAPKPQPSSVPAHEPGYVAPGRPRLVRALQAEGGATLDRAGRPYTGTGFAVARPELTVTSASPAEMQAFLRRPDVKKALDGGAHIGKWTDPQTGLTEINITDVVPDQKQALKMASQRGEQAVGHIDAGRYVGDVASPYAPVRELQGLYDTFRTGRTTLPRIAEIPAERGRQLARAYDQLPTNDPAAKGAYDALNSEIAAQRKTLEEAGYRFEFVDQDPYKTSAEMMADVRDNKRLKVFRTPTEGGSFHPYMTPEQNDSFRAVHDLVHAEGGNQFGAVGEENTFRRHLSTLSPEAQRALASETRGQNSWVNFGPNAHLPAAERPFAQQKAALWPEELMGDYDAMPANARPQPAQQPMVAGPSGRGGMGLMDMLADESMTAAHAMPGNIPGAGWQPTPRGIFQREGAPVLQGTAEIDPRIHASMPRGEPSKLAEAIADSKVVEQGLQADAERGLPLGGDIWYEGGPIKQFVDELDGPFDWNDFNLARGAGSIQNPTHNEVATVSGLLFGERQGLGSAKEISAAHQALFPDEPKLWLSEGGLTNFRRAREAGAQLPATPGSAERKVPWYTQGNLGGSLDGLPALDTHERRRLVQLAASDRRLKKLLKESGITNVSGVRADVVPIQNALDYELLGQPYKRAARRMGLPSTQAFQAGRWIGGGQHTGLKSQPTGDFVQTLEDAALFTARSRGLPTDPQSLRGLMGSMMKGETIGTPVYGKDPFARLYDGQGLLFD